MKISVIGTVGVPASYGGFETLAERLIETDKAEFTVYCSSKHYKERPKNFKNANLIYIPIDANGVSSIMYDLFSMLHALISGHKNFLILGVSGAIFFPILSCFTNVKIITNIDGIEWRREKWKGFAKLFLKFSEYIAVRFSTQIVSDNDEITKYVAETYQCSCKTIAYGGDHACELMANACFDRVCDISAPYALAICRIEPENNVHLILEAFYKASIRIVIIGNWKKSSYGSMLYNKYKDTDNITMLEPIYCLQTLYFIRSSCSIYVHGHSAGGTNPSLVEMMHFPKPIIAFDCSFNKATMEGKGNYFSNVEGLIRILKNTSVQNDVDALVEIAKRRYTWKVVQEQYLELFRA